MFLRRRRKFNQDRDRAQRIESADDQSSNHPLERHQFETT